MRIIFILLLLPLFGFGQIGPIQIIDSSTHSTALSGMAGTDLNGDQIIDIAASFTGSNGKLGYYLNEGMNSFSALRIIDSIAFLNGIASADLNGDRWEDIVTIGGTDNGVYYYPSHEGRFDSVIIIDTNITLSVNDIVIDDFDQQKGNDIVVIGQHSIDFYRNDGKGVFSKEEILTTDTSPKPLECLDLAKADFDSDGDQDLVCAETAGLVIYENSGLGEFDPHYYSEIPEIGLLVHPFDVDGDDDTDVVMKTSLNEVKWFSNDGKGNMNFESVLDISNRLHSFQSIDFNIDGMQDLFTTYTHHVSIFLNDHAHSFGEENLVVQDSSLYMDEIGLFDLDQDGKRDYVWSGQTRVLAYHLNLSTSLKLNQQKSSIKLYPNPATDRIYIGDRMNNVQEVYIYEMDGRLIKRLKNIVINKPIEISHLNTGTYLIRIESDANTVYRKLIVH